MTKLNEDESRRKVMEICPDAISVLHFASAPEWAKYAIEATTELGYRIIAERESEAEAWIAAAVEVGVEGDALSESDRKAQGESWVRANANDPLAAPPVEVGAPQDELFYIQDTRSYCGNSVMWWRVDGKGYTSNLEEAWKVPATWRARDTDKLWPVAAIDAKAIRVFDMQNLRAMKEGLKCLSHP